MYRAHIDQGDHIHVAGEIKYGCSLSALSLTLTRFSRDDAPAPLLILKLLARLNLGEVSPADALSQGAVHFY